MQKVAPPFEGRTFCVFLRHTIKSYRKSGKIFYFGEKSEVYFPPASSREAGTEAK